MSELAIAESAATGGDELRHEVKFATYAKDYAHVRSWLNLQAECFTSSYAPRHVSNLYFDTFDFHAYQENLAGVSNRTKVRLRWYGDDELPDAATLEVKRKKNKLGWKLRFPLDGLSITDDTPWSRIDQKFRQQLSQDALFWIQQNPLPAILNRYRREYFVSRDGSIRATIDTQQIAYDQRYHRTPNITRQAIAQDLLVIEFKFRPEDFTKASRLLSTVPLRIGRHSKFMNAMRSVGFVR